METTIPEYVFHRGASTPNDNRTYLCKGGWKWFQSHNPNPNTIIWAMVRGLDKFDEYKDIRTDSSHNEPTIAENAGLIVAHVSLTQVVAKKSRKNIIFSAVPPFFPPSPPPHRHGSLKVHEKCID